MIRLSFYQAIWQSNKYVYLTVSRRYPYEGNIIQILPNPDWLFSYQENTLARKILHSSPIRFVQYFLVSTVSYTM